ncbi:hypothetical protein EDB19DRAFT_1918523 [Suillus lakei]|nr:hypothetical protein EDB19DRAFT_1918523 [Suillus lakei]
MPRNYRAAIFLRAVELVSGKYRYKSVTATMLGQGETRGRLRSMLVAAELSDFFRFGVKYVEELYAQQSPKNSAESWNRVEYRALERFVLAVSPFNFTAFGGNLPGGTSDYSTIVFCVLSESSLSYRARQPHSRLETFTGGHTFQLFGLPDSRGGRRPIQFVH